MNTEIDMQGPTRDIEFLGRAAAVLDAMTEAERLVVLDGIHDRYCRCCGAKHPTGSERCSCEISEIQPVTSPSQVHSAEKRTGFAQFRTFVRAWCLRHKPHTEKALQEFTRDCGEEVISSSAREQKGPGI